MPTYRPVNPGAYNRRISIQKQAPLSVDAWGTPQPTWVTVTQTFAAFQAKTYQSAPVDAQPIIRRQAHYRTRRIPSVPITLGMRVVDTTESDVTQTWTIIDVQDVAGAQRELLLICQSVQPDQGA